MALRNAFENLGLDSTLQAIRDRLPTALGGSGGVKVEQQGSVTVAQPTASNLKVDLSDTAANATAIKVDGTGGSFPVTGTVTANQGATWDIRNVSGTVSLPTDAATSTKQSDGSQKTQIVDGSGNVIGATSNALDINVKSGNPTTMTATQGTAANLKTAATLDAETTKVIGTVRTADGSGNLLTSTTSALDVNIKSGGGADTVTGNVASGSADSGNPVKIGGRYNSTPPTLTDGQRGDFQLDTAANLRATLMIKDSGSSSVSAGVDNTDAIATSTNPSKLGVLSRGLVFNGTTWDRARGDTTSGMWVNVKSGTLGANITPTTTGGLSVYRNINLVATGVNIKGSAGQVYGWYLFNNASSVRYVKLYNKATAPSVGTDTPVMTIPLPANAAANVDFASGVAFSLGIGIGATTGVADSDSGAPSANDVIVNINYS